MPKKLDVELESYKQKIGRENFKNLYSRVYAKTLSNKRFSGRKYENSPEKLAAIKVSKRGEMYELGNSILMCGDSTNAEDVARLMGGEKADMVFTDPPYGIDYSGGRSQLLKKKDYGKLMNDDLEGQDLAHLICNIFEFNRGGQIFIFVFHQ